MSSERVSENACVVELTSELTHPDDAPILMACAPIDQDQTKYILLDFSGVQRMNGLGASMLVKLAARVRHRGQRLMAFGVSADHRDVLKVTGLNQRIRVFESAAEAVAATGTSPAETHLPDGSNPVESLDAGCWAKPVLKPQVPPVPAEAWNRNVNGRRVVGPVNGFGQLYQKTYWLRVSDASIQPEDAIRALKENLPSFQPSFNRFYPSPSGIQPGEVVLIDSSTPGGPLSTGVMVLYADDRSFTFMTPQGHPESGWVSFSAFESDDHTTVQILGLARANDPVYEAAFRAVGSKMQVKIWTYLLTSLASHLDVPPEITVEPICVDRKMQWSEAGNVWYNAQIRTLMYAPFRSMGRLFRAGRRRKGNVG